MQGGQGAVFILDGSSVMSGVDADGNLLYSDIKTAADTNWNDWLPYNEGTLGENQTISTVSTYDTDKDGASVILDTFGDIDIAFNVDHYIGSDEADVFFGSNENDTFDAASGTGNYMSGGDGVDELIVNDFDEGEDDDLNLSSMEVGRAYSHQNYTDVDVSNSGEFVSDNDGDHSGGNFYRIDFAEVNELHSFFGDNVSTEVSQGYSVSTEYALFIRTNVDPNGMTDANVMFDAANHKIDVMGTDLSILDGLEGQLVLAEQSIVEGQYVIEGRDASGNGYSTIIEDVEKVTLTTNDVEYFGTGSLTGSQEDTYELILGGQGDLGDMLYVTTGEILDSTTGVGQYSAGANFINGEVYYSGSHNDFDRNSNTNSWANTVASAFSLEGQDIANVWNDEVAQFFVWYDADGQGGDEGYEIAVKYQNGGINAWGIDNRQFDTFQNVQVDQSLAEAIKLQFGESLKVETGSYRVLYEAAFSDIETIIGSNTDVNAWNFDFTPSSSRSTFYIQVGGNTTGENGNSGVIDSMVENIKVERVDDGLGGFKWSVNPQAEILVNLPSVSGATETADVMISGDAAETIEAGRGSDVMMGRGGSDNYKINVGDTLQTDEETGEIIAGDYGVAGDVINEIGGSSEDKSDSITLSSAQSIDQLTFTRTEIKNEEWGNTLKIDVDYEQDGTVDDTLFVFDHYNQNLGFRSVEQLFLDDGWDSNEIWNLVVGDVNEAGVDEYNGSSGQDILMAGISASSTLYGGDGQDIMIGDTYNKETTFVLGNKESEWDQVADIIQGFGSNDELDLSNLGIIEGELTTDGNKLLANDVQIVEFTNFHNGFTIEDMFNDTNYITYADVV
jgi:Ca2+-binding RTX toxin-like protein